VSIPVLIRLAVDALHAAGDDGLTRTELAAAIGSRWPGRVVQEMRRQGYDVHEHNERFELVEEPASTEALASGDRLISTEAGLPLPVGDQAGASASVDAEQATLFALPPRSIYDPWSEAA
jgi:hypothetical protein